ncbi:Translin [Clohesyomyces aquaticus]|uniref:Translin n=1 Tax=Clohesyomyces aquaticus TaxID=1231657 RepID=A0A1Y2A3P6_9PLEO|nr:Translin [Clohesyomyces aquaticus]
MAPQNGMVDPAMFQSLQAQVDEDGAIRDELRDLVQALEKHNRNTAFVLSRAHSTPVTELRRVLRAAEEHIYASVSVITTLAPKASEMPYYKFNNMWTRQMQDAAYGMLFWSWLGGYEQDGKVPECGRLLTIEELGKIMHIPVNLKDRDEFHLTIEEYLFATIALVEELTRLARNSVTLGDFERPVLVNQFVKDLFAGFQILNLKNDGLRRKVDGLKYRVKDVEDVVYDLSLRNLVPKKGESEAEK